MLDPQLSPFEAKHILRLSDDQHCIVQISRWANENLRARWNTSGLVAHVLNTFYFWCEDEFDFDNVRMKFGGFVIE